MCHTSSNLFDVSILSIDWNSCNSWQINHCQIRACMGVYSQNDWLINDVFSFSCNFVCQELDCWLYFKKISKFLTWYFFKLSPWYNFLLRVIQSKFEWSSCYDTITSWQHFNTNDWLKNWGLTSGLSTKHDDSWQGNVLLKANISKLINDSDEFSHLLINQTTTFFFLFFVHLFCILKILIIFFKMC